MLRHHLLLFFPKQLFSLSYVYMYFFTVIYRFDYNIDPSSLRVVSCGG